MKYTIRLIAALFALSLTTFAFAGENKECTKSKEECAKEKKECTMSKEECAKEHKDCKECAKSKEECAKCKAEKAEKK